MAHIYNLSGITASMLINHLLGLPGKERFITLISGFIYSEIHKGDGVFPIQGWNGGTKGNPILKIFVGGNHLFEFRLSEDNNLN